MNNSKKLMKKIFLFILNSILIVANTLCIYAFSQAVFKKNFEMIIIVVTMMPIFLIIGVVFYFLKNYLKISKLNRNIPMLAIGVYLVTTFIDEAIVKIMKSIGVISHNISISIPTYPAKIVILVLGGILFIVTIVCTFKSLIKN